MYQGSVLSVLVCLPGENLLGVGCQVVVRHLAERSTYRLGQQMASPPPGQPPFDYSLYLSTSPPFRLVHLSTIVYLPAGPLAGWFTSRLVHLTTSPPHGKFTNLAPTSRLVHLTAISPLVRTSSLFVTITITDRCYHHALLKITGEAGVNPHEPAETTATVNWD